MSQYPTLCMVSYDRDEVQIPKRSSRPLRRVGSPVPKSRDDGQGTAVNYGYLSVREGIKVEERITPHRLSLSTSPRLNPEPPRSRRHTTQLTQSLTSPRYDLPLRAQTEGAALHHKRSYSDEFRLPVLRCGGAGETSLTVNAELLQDPKWNDYINAWVSSKKDGCRAYLNIARNMSLIDRGLIHYLPDFEDLPNIPCPRFWKHMHKENLKLPQPVVKKKVIKQPEFWSWKGHTTPKPPVLQKPVHCCRFCYALLCDGSTLPSRDDVLSTVEEETLGTKDNSNSLSSKHSSPGLIIINGRTHLSSDVPLLSHKKPHLSKAKSKLSVKSAPSRVQPLPPLSSTCTEVIDSVTALSSDDINVEREKSVTYVPTINVPTADAPVETVIWEPEPEKVLPEIDEEPSDYGSIQSDYLTDIQRSFVSATSSSGWSTPFDDISVDEGRVPIKTPPNIFRQTTPPKTTSTTKWEEHSFLSDSAIDSWADRDPMSPLEPLDVDMNMFFTNEYIEILEPVEWGCVELRNANHDIKLKEIITKPGLEVEVVPPLSLEPEPFKPDKIEDVDRVTIYNGEVEVMNRPEIPEPPPPPKEPTPPPPKVPTPPPPKPKRKPVVKKAKKAQPSKFKPLTPVLEPEPVKEPTPVPLLPPPVQKIATPVPPSPVKLPTLPPPPEPPPPRQPPPPKDPTPPPPSPPREPTPECIVIEPSPEPSNTATPEVTDPDGLQPTTKAPLPLPQKDLDFLAEMERERLADERRVKAFGMFEKLRRRMSFPKVQMDEVVSVKEYGWLPQFCIVKEGYKRMYKAVFDAVDENKDGYLNCFETLLALQGVTGLQNMTEKEEEYVYRVLEIADYNIAFGTDFCLFAVIAALAQKIVSVDEWVKNLIRKTDLDMLEWKMFRAKELFKWCLDEESNQLSVKKLMIELKAGGVSQEHQDEVREKFGQDGTVDLLTFLTYLPLFIMTHTSVVDNPLNDSREK